MGGVGICISVKFFRWFWSWKFLVTPCRDASPFHPTFSSLEIVTLPCAETTPEGSPGPVIAEGGKASKSGWGRGSGLEGSPEKVISDLNLEGWGGVYQTYELGKEHSRQIRLGLLFLFSPVDEKGNRHLWVFVKELGSPILVSYMSQRRRKH